MRLTVLQRCGIVASVVYALASVAVSTESIAQGAFEAGQLRSRDCWLSLREGSSDYWTRAEGCRQITEEAQRAETQRLRLSMAGRLALNLAALWMIGFFVLLTIRWIAAGGRAASKS